ASADDPLRGYPATAATSAAKNAAAGFRQPTSALTTIGPTAASSGRPAATDRSRPSKFDAMPTTNPRRANSASTAPTPGRQRQAAGPAKWSHSSRKQAAGSATS